MTNKKFRLSATFHQDRNLENTIYELILFKGEQQTMRLVNPVGKIKLCL